MSYEMPIAVVPEFRVLYEDDGVTFGFQQGKYAETPLTLTWAEEAATFTIHPAEGETALLPEDRTWTVLFRGWRKGCRFIVNGQEVKAAYDPASNTYTVALDSACGSITVTHEEGLLHDNSDMRDRIINRLIRAQINQDEKASFLKWVDDSLKLPPERLLPLNTRPDLHPNLGAHLYELLRQTHR